MQNDMKQQSYPKGEIGSKSKQLIPERPDGGEKIVSLNMKGQSVDYKRALTEGAKLKEGQNKAKENDSRLESVPKELPNLRWLMLGTKGMEYNKARWEWEDLCRLRRASKEKDSKPFDWVHLSHLCQTHPEGLFQA